MTYSPKIRRQCIMSVILLTLSVFTHAFAEPYESAAAIKTTVQQFAQQHIKTTKDERLDISIGYLGGRLHLAKCGIPLEAFLPNANMHHTNTIVGIRCEGVRPWKIYVPVKINIFKKVIVAERTLSRGTRLSSADITLAEANIAGISHGFFTHSDEVIGKVLTRSIATGIPLTANYLKNPLVIKRGQSVTILARNDSFQVSMRGTALNKGREGDVISVRNNKTKRIVDATILSGNTVEVFLG